MFLFGGREAHSRSLAKAISWRVLGSIDTFLLSWFFTSSVGAAGAIATSEVLTKMVLYYFHERTWGSIGWGTSNGKEPAAEPTIPNIVKEGGE